MYSAAFRIWTAMVTTGLAGAAYGQTLEITRSAGRQSREAPAANFTGTARVDMLFGSLFTADVSGGSVAFEPGARTAWHSHPGGQTLIVTAGVGRVQRWGDVVEEIRVGDVVRIPAESEALARRRAPDSDDPHRNHRAPRRQGCRLDGTGKR